MALSLPSEYATDIYGDGQGCIVIEQTDTHGEKVVVFLSINQFSTVVEQEKHLVREALGTE